MEAKRIELCVSADRSMLLIIRMTTAGVVSRAGLTLDELDDMKMAVDEACNLMMLQKPGCQSLRIAYEYDESMIRICIEGQDADKSEEEKPDMDMQEVIRCILESLVDEVCLTLRADGGTQKVCMKKRVPEIRRSGT